MCLPCDGMTYEESAKIDPSLVRERRRAARKSAGWPFEAWSALFSDADTRGEDVQRSLYERDYSVATALLLKRAA